MLVDSGKQQILETLTGLASPEALKFCLYTNTVAWAHGITLAGITEAAWTSYARVNVPLTSWNGPAVGPDLVAVSLASVFLPFTNGTGAPVVAKGYFVVGSSTGTLYGGDAFTPDLTIGAGLTVNGYGLYRCTTI